MEHDYTIEGLYLKFCNDAEEYDKWVKEDKVNHPPDPESPEIEKFNISRALSVMCCEIERLKHTQ